VSKKASTSEVVDVDDDEDDASDSPAPGPSTRARRSSQAAGRSRDPSRDSEAFDRELRSMEARFTKAGLGLLKDADAIAKFRKSLSPAP
jgi:hypothetical protein